MSNPPILQITDLCIERDGTRILDRVGWRIEQGQHWAILGPNGSGKTCLLSALTGYLEPTRGTIEVFGQRFGGTDWRELRRRIGLVSSAIRQRMAEAEPALETVVSGRYAMIDYWGEITAADRQCARHILRRIECEHLAVRPWRVLSQGERQRVLIGRALMANPRLLVLDEPCAGLDPAAREQFLSFLQRIGNRRAAPTLVLVTHHVEEIMPLFSHVLVLRAGAVVAAGEKERMLTDRTLSRAFGLAVKVRKRGDRYSLLMPARRGKVL